MNSIIPPRRHVIDEARRAIRREVEQRYAAELEPASFATRLLLRWKIAREVEQELRRKYPPGALYARTGP